MEVDIVSLLSTDGYIMCNKTLIKLFGGDCAILVGELCAEYNYYKAKGELTSEDSFYSTQENIEENTGLNAYQQRKALAVLKDAEIISVTKQGLPAKNYYWINKNALIKLFTICTTSAPKFKALEVQNLNLNNNTNNTNNTNNIVLSKDNTTPKDTTASKAYTREDFLGSRKSVVDKKPKKTVHGPNLFQKCMDEIDEFTQELVLHDLLCQYLNLRLSMKDKPLYSVNQWKSILTKLAEIVKEHPGVSYEEIVKQSIERGWASFFYVAPKQYSKGKKDVFSEYGTVTCEKSTGEESSGVEF